MLIINYLIPLTQRQESRTYTIRGAFEAIEAGLLLIGGFQYPQSLVMLCNSIELIVKAELEVFNSNLLVEKKLTESEIKELVSKGKDSSEGIKPNLERTVSAREAIRRIGFINQYKDLITTWKERLVEVIEKRNDIVHNGHKLNHNYGVDIVDVVFPFLNDFLDLSKNVQLKDIIETAVYREIEMAQLLNQKLKEDNLPSSDYILKTVSHKILYSLNLEKSIGDYDYDIEKENVLVRQTERYVSSIWADGDWVKDYCQICDCVNIFVKVKPYIRPTQGLIPLAALCPKCDLEIKENEQYLANFHIKLQEEVIEDYFLNDFYPEDYKDSDLDMK